MDDGAQLTEKAAAEQGSGFRERRALVEVFSQGDFELVICVHSNVAGNAKGATYSIVSIEDEMVRLVGRLAGVGWVGTRCACRDLRPANTINRCGCKFANNSKSVENWWMLPKLRFRAQTVVKCRK